MPDILDALPDYVQGFEPAEVDEVVVTCLRQVAVDDVEVVPDPEAQIEVVAGDDGQVAVLLPILEGTRRIYIPVGLIS